MVIADTAADASESRAGDSHERALPPREAARRVDWPLIVSPGFRLPRSRVPAPLPPDAFSVLRASDELARYREESPLLRRAVELARSAIGLERAAIFLCGQSPELLYGTWGTGLDRQTTDERDIAFLVGSAHREAIARSRAGLGRWLLLDRAPLTAQVGKKTRVLGYGWNMLMPIQSARGVLGLLVSDAALSGAPVNEGQQAQAAVFCALLGNLLELVRAEQRAVSLTTPVASAPRGATPEAALAARIVALLEQDASLSRTLLARRLGVSSSVLSRSFKAAMGLSVTQYKNRLRLERFLVRVERGGGNLMAAALEAGFGSYAQFHRVFVAVLGTAPKQYLARR